MGYVCINNPYVLQWYFYWSAPWSQATQAMVYRFKKDIYSTILRENSVEPNYPFCNVHQLAHGQSNKTG
jgi:hypothetical protein